MNTLWSVRTNFSVGESILSTDSMFKRAKELGYTHVAIADVMSVTALIDAHSQAAKEEMEVISGCTLRVGHWDKPEVVWQPKVYCRSGEAFVQLLKTLSRADGAGKDVVISFADFIEMLSNADYLVTSGDALSALSDAFPSSDVRELVERLEVAQKRSQRDALVLELVGVKTPYYARINKRVREFAAETGLPTIIGGMPLYLEAGHDAARDVMHAISRNMPMTSNARLALEGVDHSMRPIEDLEAIVGAGRHPDEEALVNSLKWRWSKAPISLPKMADDEFAALVQLCKDHWQTRIESSVLGYNPSKDGNLREYVDRLKMELSVLRQLGFCNYFLLVSDLVRWSKENGILVGPGRGSVGGSLIAYIIGITDVDPIRFNLLFERFINPERLDLPDADLDFMSERRHEVIEYLREKYGEDCVAQISNYNTLGPPSAIGDVGKALGVPPQDMAFKSFLPKEHGQSVALAECEDSVPELQNYMAKYPKEYEISKILEGQLRSLGTHAAGVVVAAEPLENRAVVQRRGEAMAVNWDKRVVEDQGLVKIDILGLTNLDLLARALRKIEHDYGKTINLLDVPLDDPKVLEAFGNGDTIGVFQFEGGGMRKLLKDLRKGGDLTFEELSAATALFRPGPIDSGLLDDYVAIRQGAAMENYDHPNMRPALKSTFGVIVYQEQVMQLARDLAGFTLAGADHLRKAMGKKDKAKMAAERDKWVQGCKDTSGLDEAFSNALFDQIEAFAGYAFNRSHAIEYTIISWWTMWLKVHYPHAFYAAALEVFKEDKLQGLVLDALKRGIEVLPPDINESTSEFRRTAGGHLIAPLNRVKGIGEPTEQAILAARDKVGGAFKSVEELVENVERRRCNVRHRKVLEDIGAFASVIPGSLPARHPDRTKIQLEFLPGLIAQNVRAERGIILDGYVKQGLTAIYTELREHGGFVLPRFGKKPKILVLFEAPTFHDEKAGKLMETDNAAFVKEAMKEAGLSMADVYCTTYLKVPKEGKQPSNDEIQLSKPFFDREMELLKPPVIIALGSFVARELSPGERGGIMELNGKVVYDKDRDASIVLSISPGMIFHDPAKQTMLNEAFARASELFD